jgi:hypothetical protein
MLPNQEGLLYGHIYLSLDRLATTTECFEQVSFYLASICVELFESLLQIDRQQLLYLACIVLILASSQQCLVHLFSTLFRIVMLRRVYLNGSFNILS